MTDTTRYPRIAVLLHWSVAALAFVLLATGWQVGGMPVTGWERPFFLNVHKSAGFLSALLIFAFVGWRLVRGAPRLPATMAAWERTAMVLLDGMLYVLLVLLVFSGYFTSSFSRFGLKVFGIDLAGWGWEDPMLRIGFAVMHHVAALILAVLIAIHIATAIRHLVSKDGVFQRMLAG